MAPYDDAVKAAAEALSEYYEGDGWGYFGGAAEAAVAAAAPILLAAERARVAGKDAEIERLQAALALQAESVEAASARTLGLIGAPRTGEPLSEGEQRRFEEAVVRGLQHRRADLLAAERARIAAAIRVEAAAVGVYLETEGDRVYGAGLRKAARIAETAPEEPGRCKAHRDGECHWTGCPQVRDGEPRATGRHCPLDNRTAPEEES